MNKFSFIVLLYVVSYESQSLFAKQKTSFTVLEQGAINSIKLLSAPQTTKSFQKLAAMLDNGKATYFKIPTINHNFILNDTVTIKYSGIKIFGERGGTYGHKIHGKVRNGHIAMSNYGTKVHSISFFNLGGYRDTSDGLTNDQWHIEGLSLVPYSYFQNEISAKPFLKGFSFTTRTGAPDRGALFRDVSARQMATVIEIENPDLSTNLATLVLENCIGYNNRYIVHAKGSVSGFEMRNCQFENGWLHGSIIKGRFNASFHVHDNMLEGNANAFDIKPNYNLKDTTQQWGSKLYADLHHNYMELMRGDYIFKFRTTHPDSIVKLHDNYFLNSVYEDNKYKNGAKEFCIIDSSTLKLINKDPYYITLVGSSGLILGSNILSNGIDGYRVRNFKSNYIEIENVYEHLSKKDYIVIAPDKGKLVSSITPFGKLLCFEVGDTTKSIGLGDIVVEEKDVVNLCILMKSENGNKFTKVGFKIVNDKNKIVGDVKRINQTSDVGIGKWFVLSLNFVAKYSGKLYLDIFYDKGAKPKITIGSIGIKNYGEKNDTIGVGTIIKPITPYHW